MAQPILSSLLLLLLLLLPNSASAIRSSYIIHMSKPQKPALFEYHSDWYDESLRSVSASAQILYTYHTVAHGFSASLTAAEARTLAHRPGVLSVLPDTPYDLHTTRTPEFLGLDRSDVRVIQDSDTATDIIIGVLDTGVWPERNSFDDTGFGPIPTGWKGYCVEAKDFDPAKACNRKLIGARFFSKGYESSAGVIDDSRESRSPRDGDGHGTHTSTTAAGSEVLEASLLGYAEGKARGMSTRARLAIYKVCWAGGCFSSDILAAMDAAVEDGCNVLSLSLGGGAAEYFRDSIAIGAFNAMERGVLVSCSAGNSGPGAATASNLAPWITTVGAGTIDRDFPAYVVLGDGKNFTGVSLYSGKPIQSSPISFIFAGNATNSSNGNLCLPGTLVPEKVAGKVVLCERGVNARVQKGMVVKNAGGAGMVLVNTAANGEELVADAHLLPATLVGENAGNVIKTYAISDPNPTATIIFGGTKVGIQPSPVVAAFSSRGPNAVTPEILKPDLIAPGVNILSAWTGAVGPTGLPSDSRRVEFNIISGTSMSCPHISGLAALLKGAHPDWSPAAIKSALMTTAYAEYPDGNPILDVATGKPATPFDFGAGHVDPPRAIDPGLVYDLTAEDYLDFLCALNYTSMQIAALAKGRNFSCDSNKTYAASNLNYPSFSVVFPAAISGETTTTLIHDRVVTNVGSPGIYKAVVTAKVDGGGVKITVEPSELSFGEAGEKKGYRVKFTAALRPSGSVGSGRLVWSDGKHTVSSPIAFTWI
ncbi:subtilisin-like protease SBT1.7 [Phalaenopsis equestris]|uniref:subtilisin-like protease SBT1.7 n=1 Tax=Phalaenopsis equestris TaxID=78828 RepID=UPI0009E41449|nr:subtilisin-like protease SBT1.7 [Phalaenopsis equestris]